MSAQINDLSTDLLKYIFSFLSDKQLFMIESVCKKWQICVRKLLETKNDIHLNDYYTESHYFDDDQLLVDDEKFEILKNILMKYQNIKNADLTNAHITCDFVELAKLFPKLERLDLHDTFIDVSKIEMNGFAKLIGPQLIQCDLCCCNINFAKIISKHFRKIEKFVFNTKKKFDAKQVFSHLKSCENLKILEWKIMNVYEKNPEEEIDGQDQNMIDVIQRIGKLNTQVFIFSQFKFEMNNLTELTLHGLWNVELRDFQAYQTKFNNLVKLTLYFSVAKHFFIISKFEFPKLESVVTKIDDEETPTSFFHQIKNIKSFSCENIEPNLISSLESKLFNLNHFECIYIQVHSDYVYSQYCQLFDVLSKHKSLQSIKIRIFEYYSKFDLFEKMISLSRAKPNANINIIIHVITSNIEGFDEYEKKYKEAKESKNLDLNMYIWS